MMMIMTMTMMVMTVMMMTMVMTVTWLRVMYVWLRMIDDASMVAKYDDFAKRDGRTERRTDGRTDTPAYRDVRTHLKTRVARALPDR